jgi:DNA polymerase-3 subunit epsilon
VRDGEPKEASECHFVVRPLAFLDLETTGTDIATSRIVEIAIVRVDESGEEEQFHSLINPGVPIHWGAAKIHGITDDQVKDAPILSQVIPQIVRLIEDADIAGYNSNEFDIPLLVVELSRHGYNWEHTRTNWIDVCAIFKRKERRNLSAALKFYTGRDHEDAHSAMGDVRATIDVYRAQLERYPDLPQSREELAQFSNYDRPRDIRPDLDGKFKVDRDGEYVLAFGKHKGQKAKDQPDYLRWMLAQDFLPDTKAIATQLLESPTLTTGVAAPPQPEFEDGLFAVFNPE